MDTIAFLLGALFVEALWGLHRTHKNESNTVRPCKHSVVALQDHCSYKVQSKHFLKNVNSCDAWKTVWI